MEAAKRIGVSQPTVNSLLKQRRLGYTRVGSRTLITEADIREFLDRNRVPPVETHPTTSSG